MQLSPEVCPIGAVTAALLPTPGDLAASRHRAQLRGRVEICMALRRKSEGGAAHVAALRLGEEAAAELAQIPDTQELRRHDAELLAADDAGPEGFEARIRRLVDAYRNGRLLDLFTASPIELLACCIARAASG